jgi:Protein of unknown function (DUF1351)
MEDELKGGEKMETENELLVLNMEQIIVRQGNVIFKEFENLKQQALDLAEDIKTLEVIDENVKQSKKLLATVNKRVKELEDRRIKIKKLMLEPYQTFEDQVKEIVGIVKEADIFVREQVKFLEEREREEKYITLKTIFDKRSGLYTLGDFLSVDDFLKPKHLNKTTSIDSTEKEMIAFLEKTETDMEVIKKLQYINEHVSAYLTTFDLAQAMTRVTQEKDRESRIEASQKVQKNAMKIKTFTVYDEKDFLLVEMYMNNNKIKFNVED